MFIVKTHKGPHGAVLVVTDSELLGKSFEEGKLQLDLSKEFYQGEKMSEKEVKELIKKYYILHLTGERTIKLFLEEGLVDEKRVLRVNKVPHAEVYVVEN